MNYKTYKKDSLLGAIGAFLMLIVDLCLSVIPAHTGDVGLFTREAYLSGTWQQWRLPLLLASGLLGMSLSIFSIKVSYQQIKPEYRKTRLAILIGGIIYIATVGVLHFFIGSLADWTNTLAPLVGKDEAIQLIQAQYRRLMPAMFISYAGIILMILTSAYALLTKKTIIARKMFIFHMVVFQIIFMIIPDIRQALNMRISTWDFVLSQGSGNAALCIWMLSNAVWANKQMKKEESL